MFKKLIEDVTKQTTNDENSKQARRRTTSVSSRTSESSRKHQPTVSIIGPTTAEYSGDAGHSSAEDSDDVVSISSSVLHQGPDIHELQARFQRVHRLARSYKARFQQVSELHKNVTSERDRLEELLNTSQSKSSRQVQELLEQSQLERKAKEDLDSTCQQLLCEKDDLLTAMQHQVDASQAGESLLHRQLTDSELARSTLEEQVRLLKAQMSSLLAADETSELKRQVEANGDELARLHSQCTVLQYEKEALEGELADLRSSTVSSSTELVNKDETVKELGQLHLQLNALLTANSRFIVRDPEAVENTSKQEEADQLGAVALGLKVNKLVQGFESLLAKQADEHENELQALRASRDQLQSELHTLQDRNHAVLAELESSAGQLKVTCSQLEQTRGELTELRQQVARHRQESGTLSGQLKAAGEQISNCRSAFLGVLDELKSQLVDIRCSHQTSVNGLRSKLEDIIAKPFHQLHSMCLRLHDENARLTVEQSCVQKELTGCQTRLKQVTDSSQSEVDRLRSKLDELMSSALPGHETTISELRQQISQLSSERQQSTCSAAYVARAVREVHDLQEECAARVDQMASRADAVSQRLARLTVHLKDGVSARLDQSQQAVLEMEQHRAEETRVRSQEMLSLQTQVSGFDSRTDEFQHIIDRMTRELVEEKSQTKSAEGRLAELTDHLIRVARAHFSEFHRRIAEVISSQGCTDDSLHTSLLASIPAGCRPSGAGSLDGVVDAEEALGILEGLGAGVLPQLVSASVESVRKPLVDEVSSALSKVAERQADLDKIVCEKDNLKVEISRHLDCIQRHEDELKERDDRLGELSCELQQSRIDVSKMEAEIRELKQLSKEAAERHEQEASNWAMQRDHLRQGNEDQSAEASRQVTSLELEVNQLRSQLELQARDLEDLRQRFAVEHTTCVPAGQLDAMTERQKELSAANATLKQQLEKNLQAARDQFESQREAHSREADRLTSHLTQAQAELSRVQETNVELSETVESLHRRLADCERTEVEKQQQMNDAVGAKALLCQELEDRVTELRGEVTQWKARCEDLTKADAREKHLFQQLKEMKQRLKQLLQESETLRKSALTNSNLASDAERKLGVAEKQLAEARRESDQLMRQVSQLTDQLRDIKLSDSRSRDAEREDYQKEFESLKEEHALHVQEMRRQLDEELVAREHQISGEFQAQIGEARKELQQRELFYTERENKLTEALQASQASAGHLQREIDRLESLSKLQTETADKSCLTEEEWTCTVESTRSPSIPSISQTVGHGRRNSSGAPVANNDMSASTKSENSWTDKCSILSDLQRRSGDQPVHWADQLRNQIIQSSGMDRSEQLSYGGSVSVEEYEALRLHNVDLQNQLHQFAADFDALCSQCTTAKPASLSETTATAAQTSEVNSPELVGETSSSSTMSRRRTSRSARAAEEGRPPSSPNGSWVGRTDGIHEMVEYEYLKNVLFQYMIGCETQVLSKVLCSIMRFEPDQVKQVMHVEHVKNQTWSIQQVVD